MERPDRSSRLLRTAGSCMPLLLFALVWGSGCERDARSADQRGRESVGQQIGKGAATAVKKKRKARPTILMTHPTKAFLQSLFYARKLRLAPDFRLVFLIHSAQDARIRKLTRLLKLNKATDYEVVRLTGFPQHRGFPRLVRMYRGLYPDATMERFHMSKEPFLPETWKTIFRNLVDRTDALFIPGGSNMPASFYHEKQFVEGVSTSPVRSLYELSLLKFLLAGKNAYLKQKPDYLLIGFCYGSQALNVALGGTLYQSIPIEVYKQYYVEDMLKGDPDLMHRNYHLALYPTTEELYRGWFHKIRMSKSTRFFKAGEEIYLLSNHHQAPRVIGKDLEVVATSKDGKIPEILQHTKFPNVMGVQGHPERRFALERLDMFPPDTRRFHIQFWSEVRKVLRRNHSGRVKAEKARSARP